MLARRWRASLSALGHIAGRFKRDRMPRLRVSLALQAVQ